MATTADEAIPRETSAYRPSIHFGARFNDRYERNRPPRHLDDEIVRGCIERGDVADPDDPGDETRWLHESFGGVRYRLVVDVEEMEVITGYPTDINPVHARRSGRWSEQQIEDILEFIRTDPRNN